MEALKALMGRSESSVRSRELAMNAPCSSFPSKSSTKCAPSLTLPDSLNIALHTFMRWSGRNKDRMSSAATIRVTLTGFTSEHSKGACITT